MNRIKVIDSYPGSGKTSWAIQYINTYPNQKIVYITPFLTEVQRIIDSCPEKDFVQPDTKIGGGSKMNHLISLVIEGRNIVSTHALFSNINDELIEALRINNYVLFLDEVFQTVEKYDIASGSRRERDAITKQDIQSLLAKGYIGIRDNFGVEWIDQENTLSKYEEIKRLADRELLYFVNDSLLLWTFPIEVFRPGIFNEIYILTYRFDSQLQAAYYGYFDLEYDLYYAYKFDETSYAITRWKDSNNTFSHETQWIKEIKDKIKIVDNDRLNRIGNSFYDARNKLNNYSLSLSWYRSNPKMHGIMRDNISNFFKNYMKDVPADKRLWTCYKEDCNRLKSKNVSLKHWLPINARATNDYGDRVAVCYPINRYTDPFFISFFEKKDIVIDQDAFALTELLQWVWRSAIRNNEEITLYIPSQRMRELLINFLNKKELTSYYEE